MCHVSRTINSSWEERPMIHTTELAWRPYRCIVYYKIIQSENSNVYDCLNNIYSLLKSDCRTVADYWPLTVVNWLWFSMAFSSWQSVGIVCSVHVISAATSDRTDALSSRDAIDDRHSIYTNGRDQLTVGIDLSFHNIISMLCRSISPLRNTWTVLYHN